MFKKFLFSAFLLFSVITVFPQDSTADFSAAPDFKIKAQVLNNGTVAAEASVILQGNMAYQIVNDSVVTLFNLKEMWYKESSADTVITASFLEEQFNISLRKTKEIIDTSEDTAMKEFIYSLLEPGFKTRDSAGVITLYNNVISFILNDPYQLSALQNDRLYLFNLLSAYREGFINPRIPPFSRIEFSKFLKSRSFIPEHVTMNIKIPANEINLSMNYLVEPVTDKDYQVITTWK